MGGGEGGGGDTPAGGVGGSCGTGSSRTGGSAWSVRSGGTALRPRRSIEFEASNCEASHFCEASH